MDPQDLTVEYDKLVDAKMAEPEDVKTQYPLKQMIAEYSAMQRLALKEGDLKTSLSALNSKIKYLHKQADYEVVSTVNELSVEQMVELLKSQFYSAHVNNTLVNELNKRGA